MLRRLIILLSFLAYSVMLVHNLVPHHHHDEQIVQSHHHHNHDHSEQDHHDDENRKSLSHFFGDVIHHPALKQIIHSSLMEDVQKSKKVNEFFSLTTEQVLLPDLKPPDIPAAYQTKQYSFNLFANSLLRAPPAI